MLHRFAVTLLLAVLSSVMPAVADDMDDAVASLKKDAPYETARLGLFVAGWRAAPQDAALTPEVRCNFRNEICAAYIETDGCSGTGQAFCSFRLMKPDGTILSVTTAGEPLTGLSVYGWEVAKP